MAQQWSIKYKHVKVCQYNTYYKTDHHNHKIFVKFQFQNILNTPAYRTKDPYLFPLCGVNHGIALVQYKHKSDNGYEIQD